MCDEVFVVSAAEVSGSAHKCPFPLRPVHIKDYKDQVSFPESLCMAICVCLYPLQTLTLLTKREPRCWVYLLNCLPDEDGGAAK